ncbi:MAG: zinc-ribbon domain-containing protein [Methanobrevibacter sp.]|nr:zinc-ribbon domain-containing protein [Methanobrevibacter sp.]
MKCSSCGTDNPTNAIYCKRCGRKLANTRNTTRKVTIEQPKYKQTNTRTSTNQSNKGSSAGLIACCCFAAVIIFLLALAL